MMVKILTLIGVIGLAGCSLISPYDNNEYEILARIETNIRIIQLDCDARERVVATLPSLVENAELLHTYTFYTLKNTNTFDVANILQNDIREFEQQYIDGNDSPIYCRLKTNVLLEKARMALAVVANKRR